MPPRGPDPALSLTVLERLAPAPPRPVVAERIERHTGPGDIVVDLVGRGGWIAREAIDRGRRSLSIETGPIARLLAELVLRPPDVRHLDAAFQAMAASPHGDTSLRHAVGALFATRCPTCERRLVADEIGWQRDGAGWRPVRKQYHCAVCRDQRGGGEIREAPVDDADVALAVAPPPDAVPRATLAARFPVPDAAQPLIDDLLALHTDRQLTGLAWVLERVETDLRAEPIEAALRLSLLEAVIPASRLAQRGGRSAPLRVAGGRLRPPGGEQWRERNPWPAFEAGFAAVRAFVQGLGGGPLGPVQARFGEDLRSLAEGPANTVLRTSGASTARTLASEAASGGQRAPRVRLAIAHPLSRSTPSTTALHLLAAGWALGRDAAASVPLAPLLDPPGASVWTERIDALVPLLAGMGGLLRGDARAVVLVDEPEPEALVAAAFAGAAAGYRVIAADVGQPGAPAAGSVELVPPSATLPPGPRTRANVQLPPVSGGSGDPRLVPGRGLFGAPEAVDARPFSAAETARVVVDTGVAVLRERGEPAAMHRLLSEIIVGLDRAGQLQRLARVAREEAWPDPVERLLAIVGEELRRPAQRRLVELAPDTWWLGDRDDRAEAATPLADRVEWAVYSLLSTGGTLNERTFHERLAALFPGVDRPDRSLVDACLASYRSPAAAPDRLATDDDLVARAREHTALLALLADGGHRAGMDVWIAAREQARPHGGRRLGDTLTERERTVHLPAVARGAEDALEAVDCIWYVRGKAAFTWEVEWTAMLGEPLLRRHARIPPDERVVRFLVIPTERTELVRYKLGSSLLLRAAVEEGNWHILKWPQLAAFLAADTPDLSALEPLLGLDPEVERSGEQLPLFAAER